MDWNEGLVIEQGPDAVEIYTHDFTTWLGGDAIVTHAVSSSPVGLTVDSDSHTDTSVTYRVSGGDAGTMYAVSVSVVTTSGREGNKPVLMFIDIPLAVRIAGIVR